MKNYLNSNERETFFNLVALGKMIEGYDYYGKKQDPIYEEWLERGTISKDEKKYLKSSLSWLIKFLDSVLNRLDSRHVEQYQKQFSKMALRRIDDYTVQKLSREIKDKSKEIVMDRELFYDYCVDIMEVNCKGCVKNGAECKLCMTFEDNLVPAPTGEKCDNCRYAYEKEE